MQPVVASKWLLASALQKSLRRGHADLAHEYADRLRELNLSYLTFRLGVISLEDIGPGDWELVGSVLSAIRDRKPESLPGLAAKLASSPKSRSVCDATMLAPGDTLDLSPLLRFISSCGAGFEKLGRFVPNVVQLLADHPTEIVVNPPDLLGDEMIAGFPAATFDKHTREGGSAIRIFGKRFTQFTDAQIALAVFFEEGAHLDRELVFDGSDGLRITDVEASYRRRGLESRDAMSELTELIRGNRELLNSARRRVLGT